jgi:hypothetical protein
MKYPILAICCVVCQIKQGMFPSGLFPGASILYVDVLEHSLCSIFMKMEQTECSETSLYKIQTPGNYPEENIQHSEHGESLKSRLNFACKRFQSCLQCSELV